MVLHTYSHVAPGLVIISLLVYPRAHRRPPPSSLRRQPHVVRDVRVIDNTTEDHILVCVSRNKAHDHLLLLRKLMYLLSINTVDESQDSNE